jgi:hypothetical protein
MPDIQRIELERENDTGVYVEKGGGHGEVPVNDPPPADVPNEPPFETEDEETEDELQARESEAAFDRAIVRLPPG